MINYKATISYDGTNYKGWQVQSNTSDTIQGKLQDILEKLAGEKVEVIGSGRTDAGVHAIAQVANFHLEETVLLKLQNQNDTNSADSYLDKASTNKNISTENNLDKALLMYINEKLPRDIALNSLEQVNDKFHARFNAIEKTYRYRIHVSPIANVFEKRFVYTYLDYPLDIDFMRKAAGLMLGKKDFKAFCGNKHMKKSTVRTLNKIDIKEITDENGLREISIDYTGDGFLQNMIRIMTGTLIEVGSGRRKAESISETIQSLNRENAGYTAPPQGLSLLEVKY